VAKDPVCGMFVEKKPDSIGYTKNGKEYYFCSAQCLNEFREPEKELKKLKIKVAVSIALTIPIVFLACHICYQNNSAMCFQRSCCIIPATLC